MTTRSFTIAELTALGVPPDSPKDIEYSDILQADEPGMILKYTQQRTCVFEAPDDGITYAVKYEAPIDTGDYEVGDGMPDNHGWRGEVEAVEVEHRPVTVYQWVPVDQDDTETDTAL
ncbi:hypothetical protein HHL19_16340 [Streptomyces sp. R302]|uniref:hypothetical protein n=1 Tax=unclassified Streptomyces TaxID=2593676 RepID=UPI00145DC82A|nr:MULTISPECIES: hypothetical protein [unclassified Streptomyces]NML55340.1 hypothetical protein [Streptomyces sp. R301]NML80212.1 hypothetical protein [Streptomyces sp. R302]